MKVLLASIKADIEIFPVNQGSVGRDVFNRPFATVGHVTDNF